MFNQLNLRKTKTLKKDICPQPAMLRTNKPFLTFIETLYQQQERKENIIVKKYSRGERLFCQQAAAPKVMVISAGIAKCYFTEDNDKEYILEFLGNGEILGEVEAIRHISSLCSIEALTDVTVYVFSSAYFRSLLTDHIDLNALLLNVFAERIVNTASRASYQQLYTVEYSLIKLIELQSKLDLSLSKEDMASYLGITLRSLNRGLSKLQKSSP